MLHRSASLILPCLLALAPSLAEAEEQQPDLVPLSTTTGTLVVGNTRAAMPVARSAVGNLVALDSVVRALGGSLRAVPGTRHAFVLAVQNTEAVLGIGSQAVTLGDTVLALSQPPRSGVEGPLVPIDLLQRVYGDQLGYEFTWSDTELTLEVMRAARRQIPLLVDVVQLEGLMTLVMQFAQAPVHEVIEEPGRVRIELRGDEARLSSPVQLPARSLAERVEVEPARIVIHLLPGVQADHYVLTEPFRLVFDLYPAAAPDGPQAPEFTPPGSRHGIRTIVLDPGHGGYESGARGPAGSLEKDLTLTLGHELKRALERQLAVNVELTRERDEYLDLDGRSAFANAHKADLFISLHLNSTRRTTAHGAETYFMSLTASDEAAARAAAAENAPVDSADDPLYDLQLILWDMAQSRYLEQSQDLAKLIQGELNRSLGLADRGVKQAPFRVLKGAAMPAVLVELGFINNPQEEERLNDPAYRRALVDALVRAVQRHSAADPSPMVLEGAP